MDVTLTVRIITLHFSHVGRDSSVRIATRYGLEDPETEFRWETKYSTPVQTVPEAYPTSCIIGTG